MVVIPKGARNIRLVEADEAANYIAIQSVETNEYYLNGQWYTPNLIHFFFFSIVFEILFSFLLLSFEYCASFAGRFNGRVNIEPDSRSFIIDVKASWKKSIFQDHRWKTSVSWLVF